MTPRAPRTLSTLAVSIHGHTIALSSDVSTSGFCLESPKLLSIGDEVSGTVRHGTLKLSFTGRVTWSKPGGPMGSIWHRMGVQFDALSPGLRALLAVRMRGA
ncbi:MAG: PilZ domain-containing protein [Myxococcaceae bacterium]